MSSAHRHRGAISLVEILVVLAVVAVLAAMLLPAMRTVKELAYQARCAGNMRQTGVYLLQFEADNRGRMVGSAYATTGSVSWNNIINTELLADSGAKLPRMDGANGNSLLCPKFNPPPLSYRRCFIYNWYAAGGDSDMATQYSQYGQVIDPPASRHEAYKGWKFYCLGAPRLRFAEQSRTALLQESYGGGDYFENNGRLHFRHRGGKQANFLYLDGRVESHRKDENLSKVSKVGFL